MEEIPLGVGEKEDAAAAARGFDGFFHCNAFCEKVFASCFDAINTQGEVTPARGAIRLRRNF